MEEKLICFCVLLEENVFEIKHKFSNQRLLHLKIKSNLDHRKPYPDIKGTHLSPPSGNIMKQQYPMDVK